MSYEEILTEARRIEEKHAAVLEENRRLHDECKSALRELVSTNKHITTLANELQKADAKIVELEKTNTDLLAEALRLGKLHDDAEQKVAEQRKCLEDSDGIIERLNNNIEVKNIGLSNQRKIIDALRKENSKLERRSDVLANESRAIKLQLSSTYGKFGQSAPQPPGVPASVYNWVPGQRIVDTSGREYIKLQSTASANSAVDTKTGKIVNLSFIIVERDKYHAE